jgi:hypothetical protein
VFDSRLRFEGISGSEGLSVYRTLLTRITIGEFEYGRTIYGLDTLRVGRHGIGHSTWSGDVVDKVDCLPLAGWMEFQLPGSFVSRYLVNSGTGYKDTCMSSGSRSSSFPNCRYGERRCE